MVNASLPAGYVEYPPTSLQLETKRLVVESGYILSSTDFIHLESKKGIRLGGEDNKTNLQFYGVNPSYGLSRC